MRISAAAILTISILAGIGSNLRGTAAAADDAYFWVVGSAAKGCWVVQKNPVVDGRDITFSDGPYRSMDDAKLAMTTIGVCKT
jgi:hypothetical protein